MKKQNKKLKQKQETQQKKQQKPKQNEKTQQNKQQQRETNNKKPNQSDITMYLTKNNSQIEARAASYDLDNNQGGVNKITSKEVTVTSASSRIHSRVTGIQTEQPIIMGDAAKGMPE